jgi:hypothetical protein
MCGYRRSILAPFLRFTRSLRHSTVTRSAALRIAILWIKDVWHRMPSYPDQVSGMDIYDAVLEHGVRTPEQFGRYLRQRGLPTA